MDWMAWTWPTARFLWRDRTNLDHLYDLGNQIS